MGLLPLVLAALAALTDLPAAEIETTRGERQTGKLAELSDSALRLRKDDAAVDIPLTDILTVRLPPAADPETIYGYRVVLADGSRLTCSEFNVKNGQAQIAIAQGGELVVPIARVAQVRFGNPTAKLDEAWSALAARESKTDLLIVKKEDVLDHLDGAIGDVGENVSFLLDGDLLPVGREKVYGIIIRRKAAALPKSVCRIELTGGDVLQAVSVGWDGAQFHVRLAAGPELKFPASALLALDFSGGRLVYLSQLEPREVKYVPYFDDGFSLREYRRDRSLDGTPISLAGKTYARGLAIHSKTTLRYRIAGEYTRFQATIGIDDSVRRVKTSARLAISGDGKPLFDSEVTEKDAPRRLDLDVSGVRDLEILVDYGSDMIDIADHLDLADAKLLK